jgi:hypothetical protein
MSPRSIRGRSGPASALACAAVLALVGCGQATGPARPAPAADPIPAAGGQLDPSLAQWPATGCDGRSVVSVDYGRMATGWRTPQQAVEHSPAGDLPAGVLRLAPVESAKGPAQVWVVDPVTNEIQAEVSVFRGPDGWFVDGVMTCS